MKANQPADLIAGRLASLRDFGLVDFHFDLPMHLYEQRDRANLLTDEFLPEFEAGGIGVVVASVYLEDRYLRDAALKVGLGQIARLHSEVELCDRFRICRSSRQIEHARAERKVALLIGMEGVEPLGSDLDLLRAFYELGLRVVGLTHARRNAAASGAAFTANGSSPKGLSEFGRALIRECERLGIIIDLAHINSAGFDEILQITSRPLIVSHTNARKFYDIDRNVSDEQIEAVGRRGGVIGINSVLVSSRKEEATIDRYVDHIEHVIGLIGIDGVGLGLDFFEFIYRQWSDDVRAEFHAKFPNVHFIPDLANHAHAPNLTSKLIERAFSDQEIEKIISRNWMRIFQQLL
jgi:membrane dipeptidase